MAQLYTNESGGLIRHDDGSLMSGEVAGDCCCDESGCPHCKNGTDELLGYTITVSGVINLAIDGFPCPGDEVSCGCEACNGSWFVPITSLCRGSLVIPNAIAACSFVPTACITAFFGFDLFEYEADNLYLSWVVSGPGSVEGAASIGIPGEPSRLPIGDGIDFNETGCSGDHLCLDTETCWGTTPVIFRCDWSAATIEWSPVY